MVKSANVTDFCTLRVLTRTFIPESLSCLVTSSTCPGNTMILTSLPTRPGPTQKSVCNKQASRTNKWYSHSHLYRGYRQMLLWYFVPLSYCAQILAARLLLGAIVTSKSKHSQMTIAITGGATVLRVHGVRTMLGAERAVYSLYTHYMWHSGGTLVANEVNKICQINLLGQEGRQFGGYCFGLGHILCRPHLSTPHNLLHFPLDVCSFTV